MAGKKIGALGSRTVTKTGTKAKPARVPKPAGGKSGNKGTKSPGR